MQAHDRLVELRETAVKYVQFEHVVGMDGFVEVKPLLDRLDRFCIAANGQLLDSHTAIDQRLPSSVDRSGSRQVHKTEVPEDLDQRQVR